ncbi:MAG: methionine aminotransferase [Bacteroidota bacterium]
MNFTSKLPNVETTIFTKMSALAAECNALDLSQGFPDYDCDDELKKLVSHFIKKGHNQYAPMAGLLELRQALSSKIEHIYSRNYNPESEITITAGATQAIYTALGAIVRPKDEVIIFSPAYDCYAPAIELYGGRVVEVPLKTPNYTIDYDLLAEYLSERTRAIILNSPHNPTGTVFSKEDLAEVAGLLEGTNTLVISDEVYEHIVFEGAHYSACQIDGLSDRSFVVSSFGKTYHNTGWKMGYCYAPKGLMSEFRKVHQYNVFCVNRPFQHAFAEFMRQDKSYSGLSAFYKTKRDFFLDQLAGSRLRPLDCNGTYFLLLEYEGLSTKSDLEYAKELCTERGIATIPLSPFYSEPPNTKVLRICFAKDEETLRSGAKILKNL